jgi:hypothetical protein
MSKITQAQVNVNVSAVGNPTKPNVRGNVSLGSNIPTISIADCVGVKSTFLSVTAGPADSILNLETLEFSTQSGTITITNEGIKDFEGEDITDFVISGILIFVKNGSVSLQDTVTNDLAKINENGVYFVKNFELEFTTLLFTDMPVDTEIEITYLLTDDA